MLHTFKACFNAVQELIKKNLLLAGHDISAGGMLTALLEMCFAENNLGAKIDLSKLNETDVAKVLFSEKSGVIIQSNGSSAVEEILNREAISFVELGTALASTTLEISNFDLSFDIATYRDFWFSTSYLLDKEQTANNLAEDRFEQL